MGGTFGRVVTKIGFAILGLLVLGFGLIIFAMSGTSDGLGFALIYRVWFGSPVLLFVLWIMLFVLWIMLFGFAFSVSARAKKRKRVQSNGPNASRGVVPNPEPAHVDQSHSSSFNERLAKLNQKNTAQNPEFRAPPPAQKFEMAVPHARTISKVLFFLAIGVFLLNFGYVIHDLLILGSIASGVASGGQSFALILMAWVAGLVAGFVRSSFVPLLI